MMIIKKPESFWDVLIWVSVLLAAFIGLGVLLHHFCPEWGRLIWALFVGLLLILQKVPFVVKWTGKFFPELLSWMIATASAADIILKLMDRSGENVSWIGWIFPVILLLQTNKLYRESRKKEEEARKKEELLRETQELLSHSLKSDKKALILLFNARMEEVSFEVDDRMILYSLPDGRFLVLFRKQVSLEDFLRALAAFRTEVDRDEDAVGLYGQTFYGARPDHLQAFVSDLAGVCRIIPFDLDTASLSGAEPV